MLDGVVVSSTNRPLYQWERNQVLDEHEAGWTQVPVWKCAISLVPPTGFDPRTAYFRARGRLSFLSSVLHQIIYTARNANRNNSMLNSLVVKVRHDVTTPSAGFWIRSVTFYKNRRVIYRPQIRISTKGNSEFFCLKLITHRVVMNAFWYLRAVKFQSDVYYRLKTRHTGSLSR